MIDKSNIEKIIENKNSECVRLHISNLQAIIQRMANSSASCKTWCITIFSAIFVFLLNKGKTDYTLILIIPTLSFFLLDTYYLYQERFFREQYNLFQASLNKDDFNYENVYLIKSQKENKKSESIFSYIKTINSPSIYIYYGFLILVIVMVALFFS